MRTSCALGYWLDQQAARGITITELVSLVAVAGWVLREGYHQTSPQPFEALLSPEEIQGLLDDAFRRRRSSRRPIFARLRF